MSIPTVGETGPITKTNSSHFIRVRCLSLGSQCLEELEVVSSDEVVSWMARWPPVPPMACCGIIRVSEPGPSHLCQSLLLCQLPLGSEQADFFYPASPPGATCGSLQVQSLRSRGIYCCERCFYGQRFSPSGCAGGCSTSPVQRQSSVEKQQEAGKPDCLRDWLKWSRPGDGADKFTYSILAARGLRVRIPGTEMAPLIKPWRVSHV